MYMSLCHRTVSVRESNSESLCEEGGDFLGPPLLCLSNSCASSPQPPNTHAAISRHHGEAAGESRPGPPGSNSLPSLTNGKDKKSPIERINIGS